MGDAGDDRFEGTLAVRRASRVQYVALALLPIALVVFLLTVGSGDRFSHVSPMFSWFAMMPGLLAQSRRKRVLTNESVQIDQGGLTIGTERVPRARIRDAQLAPTADAGMFVRVQRRWRTAIELGVQDRDEGHRVLRALGLDASQSVTSFRTSSGVGAVVAVAVLLGIVFSAVVTGVLATRSSHGFGGLIDGAAIALVLAMATPLLATDVDVGADAVVVRGRRRTRVIPLSKVRRVEVGNPPGTVMNRTLGALLHLEDGRIEWLPTGRGEPGEALARALVERIESAREALAGGSVAPAAALLGRQERGVHDWIRELRAIGAGANATLRTAAVNAEQLWRIVENHGAAAEDRAAAAVALRASLDDGGEKRLRVAVAAAADKRLRVAIDATLGNDEAALEEALGEVAAATMSRAD